ncbi:MAG: hypothetical protein AAGG01_15435 [Planctomycetota bacterium]
MLLRSLEAPEGMAAVDLARRLVRLILTQKGQIPPMAASVCARLSQRAEELVDNSEELEELLRKIHSAEHSRVDAKQEAPGQNPDLRAFEGAKRADLLAAVPAAVPVLLTSGPEELIAIANSIHEVVRWWP